MTYDVAASSRIGTSGRLAGLPAGLQHALAAGVGTTVCGLPRDQLHVFDDLAFPYQLQRSCRVCLSGLSRQRAS